MPEELVIVLVILIGGVWLVIWVLKAIGSAITETQKSLSDASERRKRQKYLKNRLRFSNFVQAVLPDDLSTAQRHFERAQADFQEFQAGHKWVAERPGWTSLEFTPYRSPRKDTAYKLMDVRDISSVLTPDTTTWLQEESHLLTQSCKYSANPPANTCREFRSFPSLTLKLGTATLQYDVSKVSNKDIVRYFREEQNSVNTYNKVRTELSLALKSLNRRIDEWNSKSRHEWDEYAKQCERLTAQELSSFNLVSQVYVNKCKDQQSYFKAVRVGYEKGSKNEVVERLSYVLDHLSMPASVPHTWEIDFDDEQRILIVEVGLPDVVHHPPYKTVLLKSGSTKKPLNQTERREIVPQVHPAVLLRVAYEIFRGDDAEIVRLLVLNGWIEFDDPSTGLRTKAYTASLMVERHQIVGLNLKRIDPFAAFDSLHGKSAGKLVEIVPIEPTLSLNRKDSRFVDAKAVLSTLGTATNLAAMDWQDFEHLIRELFEKEFAGRGAEVKITQASRDRGVDAIVFDPDPIHGGKYVIQAKRYTNTVDVSAVRDLCAVVKKEGASRGILVTTSTYGSDAYAFANNEPVTLLNGAELLGLLQKHGYSFRINLQEPRKVLQSNMQTKSRDLIQ